MSESLNIGKLYPDRYATKPQVVDKLIGRCNKKLAPKWYNEENRDRALGLCFKGIKPQVALRSIGCSSSQISNVYNRALYEPESIFAFIHDELEQAYSIYLCELCKVSHSVLTTDTTPAIERLRLEKIREIEKMFEVSAGSQVEETTTFELEIRRVVKDDGKIVDLENGDELIQ